MATTESLHDYQYFSDVLPSKGVQKCGSHHTDATLEVACLALIALPNTKCSIGCLILLIHVTRVADVLSGVRQGWGAY